MHFRFLARNFIYFSLLIQNFNMYYGEVDVRPHLSITGREIACFTSQQYCPYSSGQFVGTCEDMFQVMLTVLLSIILDNNQLGTHLLYFLLQYVYYNPLHVQSIICSSSRGWIVLMQHLVSAFSVNGRPVHSLRDNSVLSQPVHRQATC